MLRIDRICVWTFLAAFVMILPALTILPYVDELLIYSLLGWVALDCIINREIRKYRPLLIFLSVVLSYVAYSLTAVHFNVAKGVLLGAILEIKPFIALIVFICVMPAMTPKEKGIAKIIAYVSAIVVFVSLLTYEYSLHYLYSSPYNIGGLCFASAMTVYYCSISEDGTVPKKDILAVCLILIMGLACTRSKYYGEFIISMTLVFAYRQGITRHLKLSHIIGGILVAAVLVAAVWQKFNFYFVSGLQATAVDVNAMDSYARLALYAGMGLILADYPLFGSGFGSFASFASGKYYSSLYQQYGLEKVYGLSESFHNFISDAYYPSLAQFGFTGILLFIWFWVWVYRNLRVMTRVVSERYRNEFVVGVSILAFIFVEMTAGTMVFQPIGEVVTMLLALICVSGKKLREDKALGVACAPQIVIEENNRII